MSSEEATQSPATLAADAKQPGFTLLCVDDEANILSALKRLFRPHGYTTLTATSGQEGLAVLESEHVDLVISDMRMPEMNGAQFLEQVKIRRPDTVRLLLTGYAEMAATVDAINKGGIYRYISKPWDDAMMVDLVREALERLNLEREKRRLEAVNQQQFEALKDLNANLELRVKQRTEEVRQTMTFLELANEQMKKNFMSSVRLLASMIDMRADKMAGHSRKVTDLARQVAAHLNLKTADFNDLMHAALLHDIGMLGLPDSVLDKPFSALNAEERQVFTKHPEKGQLALMAMEDLKGATMIIRSHHERFDGQGYPDGLSGMNIPLGARILAAVNDYDDLQNGSLTSARMKEREAREYICAARGTRYDPQVVDAFMTVLGVHRVKEEDVLVNALGLKVGMVLARDLTTAEGIMLLAKAYVLTDEIVAQILTYEKSENKPLSIYVKT